MLLVTFHGGTDGSTQGITNVYAYDTGTGALNTATALTNITLPSASELRALAYANSLLYVVNGAKHISNIMCFEPPPAGSTNFEFKYLCDFIDASFSKKGHFQNSIAHPYSLAFDGAGNCFISNQDTNVVAKAVLGSNFQTASVQSGCQSAYLKGLTNLCPKEGCVYLDGTFVASQTGALPEVNVAATDVPASNGGLKVSMADTEVEAAKTKPKVQNSVRDVAIYGGVLLVCDEPSKLIRLYLLADGTYLGSSAPLPSSPTHLTIQSGGLFVSAGSQLYWSALPASPTPSDLSFTSVLQAPSATPPYKVGGISFGPNGQTVYVALQQGTGSVGTGAIYLYSVQPGSDSQPPVLAKGSQFAGAAPNPLPDTPEFVLYIPNP